MVNERGQLLLIGAVVIGVTIVGSVVLLNGMQYAGAAGTQDETGELDRAERTEAAVERDLNRLAAEVLESNPSRSRAETALRENITVYGNYSRNMSLSRGSPVANVTYNASQSEGSQVGGTGVNLQSVVRGSDRLEDVEYLRHLTVVITGFTSGSNGEFKVEVEDESGNTWSLRVDQTAAGFDVITDPTSGPQTTECSVSQSSIELHLVSGTGDCDIRGLRETMETVDSVEFEGIDNPQGDYTIRYVDANTGLSASPYPVRPAATLRYRSQELSYNRTLVLNETGGVP